MEHSETIIEAPTSSPPAAISGLPPDRQSAEEPTRVELNLYGSLGAFPGSSLGQATFKDDNNAGFAALPDLISCGTISSGTGIELFAFFQEQLNARVYYMLEATTTLREVRARSSLLTAATCTVAALCMGSTQYTDCLKAFQEEVSRRLFAQDYGFDDVRALCIGAFWLSDLCPALIGMGKYRLHLRGHRSAKNSISS